MYSGKYFLKCGNFINTAQPKFKKTELKQMKFLILCLEEQIKIANFLYILDTKYQ